MSMPLAILKADLAHLEPVCTLIAETRDHLLSIGISQWDDHYPGIQTIQDDLDNGSLFIAYLSGLIVGTVALDSVQDPEYQRIPWKHPGPALVVHRLCVSPARQGQGIGMMLMDFSENHAVANGFSSIRLDVYSGNPSSVRFYQRRGYQMAGQFMSPWRSQPFHCMEKPLGQAGIGS